jgi:hypothetical protein
METSRSLAPRSLALPGRHRSGVADSLTLFRRMCSTLERGGSR